MNTVQKIEDGEITVEARSVDDQRLLVWVYTSDWHVRKRGTRAFDPAIPQYAFPLEVGKSWEGKYTGPDLRGASMVDYELKGKVVGAESVTVSAGTFDAVKIQLETSWVYKGPFTVGGSVAYGTFVQTIWYAPKAKRFVKMDVESHSRPFLERIVWELKELKLN